MNVSRQPYGKIVRLKWFAVDQIEAKSLHSMYSEVVAICHRLRLEVPDTSSDNFLTATNAFIEIKAVTVAPDTKDLPKNRRRKQHKLCKAIAEFGGAMPDDLPHTGEK